MSFHRTGERYLSVGLRALSADANFQAALELCEMPSTRKVRALLAEIESKTPTRIANE